VDRHSCRQQTLRRLIVTIVTLVAMTASHPVAAESPVEALRATESAFAATMAARDLAAFTSFIDPEAIFHSGSGELHGRGQVVEFWTRYFEGDDAPFSWIPEEVSVLDSGALGQTSGPVFDAEGTRIGTFISVWRLTDDGDWKIVFDRGCR
jgi:ketosteroid isomerase-like protein